MIKLLKIFSKQWKEFFISFLVALFFWLFLELNKEHNALISYPIEFQFNDEDVVVVESLPNIVKVDVSGIGWKLLFKTFYFTADPILFRLDNPSEVKILTQTTILPVVSESLNGLTINFLETDTLFINIEKKIAKDIKILIDSLELPLAPNYKIVSPVKIEPPIVTILGPESYINSYEEEYYIQVENTDISKKTTEVIKIPIVHSELIEVNPSQVKVSFDVNLFKIETITLVAKTVNFPKTRRNKVSIADSTFSISYEYNATKNKKIENNEFQINLDYNLRITKDSTILPILIAFPQDAHNIKIFPRVVKLIYEK